VLLALLVNHRRPRQRLPRRPHGGASGSTSGVTSGSTSATLWRTLVCDRLCFWWRYVWYASSTTLTSTHRLAVLPLVVVPSVRVRRLCIVTPPARLICVILVMIYTNPRRVTFIDGLTNYWHFCPCRRGCSRGFLVFVVCQQ